MAAMDVIIGEDVVGTCLNHKKTPTAQKVLNTTMNGSVYGQQTGDAIIRYEMIVYCPTKSDRDALDQASNQCGEITVILRDNTEVTGIIEDVTIEWKEWEDGHGVGTFVLIEE